MDIEYLHLYVKNAPLWRDWFVEKLTFQPLSTHPLNGLSEFALQSGQILILISSEQTGNPAVKPFLHHYAEGVADVAFRVRHLDGIVAQVQRAGGQLTHPVQSQESPTGDFRWCQIQGWGSVSHTLIEFDQPPEKPIDPWAASQGSRVSEVLDLAGAGGNALPCDGASFVETEPEAEAPDLPWLSIDHAVLNVPVGELEPAVTWYETHLGFVRQQQFAIATAQSGLRSFVLKHPEGSATLPINEPTSQNSQIQEFLDLNRGAGIQHVALQTTSLVKTVARLRQRGVPFLSVPSTYYEELQTRPGFWHEAGDWEAIAQQQILVDWPPEEPQTRLLQTFMQPLFERPTFFWELIERQTKVTPAGIKRAEGFGAGNFQALFEAIEREQQQRGSL